MSRHHAALLVEDGKAWIVSLHSTNPTFLNNAALDNGEQVCLEHGDRIGIAGRVFIFEYRTLLPCLLWRHRAIAMAAAASPPSSPHPVCRRRVPAHQPRHCTCLQPARPLSIMVPFCRSTQRPHLHTNTRRR